MPAPQLERVLTACRLHQPSQRCAPPRIQHQCYRCVNPVRKVLPLRVSLYTHAMSATDPLKSRALTERQPWTLNRGYEPPRRGPATISGMSPVTQVCQDENTVAGWSGLENITQGPRSSSIYLPTKESLMRLCRQIPHASNVGAGRSWTSSSHSMSHTCTPTPRSRRRDSISQCP